MEIKINFRSGIPIYRQIQDQVIQMIQNGNLSVGDQLPPVRQLADNLHVNFNTVARAYRHLDENGLISTQHGRGTYILSKPNLEMNIKERELNLEKLTIQFLQEAFRLGYTPDKVQVITQQKISAWLTDGEPPHNPQD
ncbi:MAG: GntR family transcriptional regulator [Anaerolineales bacterium]|nr:GntR family transcriptional regulator [Anaerolineales bacterium]